MKNLDVIGLGALNMDNLYQVEHILDDGETTVDGVVSTPGGSAANTTCGLARLGVSMGFVGVVGDDAEGTTLLQDFKTYGVDTSCVGVKPGARTGSVLCLSDRQGKRSLYILPGANNLLSRDDLNLTYLQQAKLLHVSSFVHDTQFQITLDLVKKLEPATRISLAPGSLYAARGSQALAPILKRTHVLFLNGKEMRQLTGEDFRTGAERCLQLGCQIVAVTLGEGIRLEWSKEARRRAVTAVAYIRDAGNEYIIEPVSSQTPALDTTGAGDAFAAGFLYGLLHNQGREICGRLGDIVARFSMTKLGARAGLPTLRELSRRYRELYHQEW